VDIRELEVGESLFQEGDDADTAYIIEVGALKISTRSDGDKVVICSLVDGDIVGEMGIIDGAPRTATATALKQARLLCVTQNQLTDQISEADDILKLLVQVLLERCRSGLSKMKGDPRSAEPELVAREYVHHGINKMRLESELRLALQSDELIVFYQPIVDLRSGHIAGFEALTRWIHPVRGFRSPGLFISLAEETDLIVPVGLQVFKQASADMVRLQNSADAAGYHHPLFMSINVSGRQVINEFFLTQAAEIVGSTGLSRDQFKLEITESFAIDVAAADRWISEAHGHGFKVSLDDFGTGMSSLETLYRLDLDAAKIDRAFVIDLAHNLRNRQLTRDIVAMIQRLGLEVIVEGIEERSQLEFIRALDCQYVQGYLFGKFLPVEEAEALFLKPPVLD
jgi:EAL domain-containing protein (putative c-di-GMP-specific phosphodiesterase class I)